MGLLPPQSGSIFLDGKPVDYRRRQDVNALRYRVFQNMSAMRNVSIAPLKIKKRSRDQVERGRPGATHQSRIGRQARVLS